MIRGFLSMPNKISPCIGVCKYTRDDHCIGCSMTKTQKKIAKKLKKEKQQEAFMSLVIAQQNVIGGYDHWEGAYNRKKKQD